MSVAIGPINYFNIKLCFETQEVQMINLKHSTANNDKIP